MDDISFLPNPNAPSRRTRRVFVLGPRRAGKTSIQRVVFHKLQPHETLYIETTTELQCSQLTNPLVDFEIWDFPGGYEFTELDIQPAEIFPSCRVVVCVVDAQMRSYPEQLKYCENVILLAHQHNPDLKFHVFIHKVEPEMFDHEDAKFSLYKEIHDTLMRSLEQNSKSSINITCHTTSIYDQSIFEAFSKVIQSLIMPQISSFLENMLNLLVTNCDMEKAYIFDIVSKIYLSTDSNPTNSDTFGLCSDVIDTVIDITAIYGAEEHSSGFDKDCESTISLNSDQVLITRQLAKDLALVCYMTKDLSHSGTIKHNFEIFRQALAKMLQTYDAALP